MKAFKRSVSLFLVVGLLLSIFTGTFASGMEGVSDEEQVASNESSALNKGIFNPEFRESYGYEFQDRECVRVIVLLSEPPLAEIEDVPKKKSAHTRAIEKEHKAVFAAMSALDYELMYEYDTLLNGFSCEIAYGDLERVAQIPGVASIHLDQFIEVSEVEPAKKGNSGGAQMTGALSLHDSGFTGEGLVIAVLDMGLDVDHAAFQLYDSMPVADVLTEERLAEFQSSGNPYGERISKKIPFVWDYAGTKTQTGGLNPDATVDLRDSAGKVVAGSNDHGTMTSAVAVGYAEDQGAVIMRGSAPAAQLVFMKCAYDGAKGFASGVQYKAYEDALKLDVDVINYSGASGTAYDYDPDFDPDLIFKRLEDAGIIVCISAGNDRLADNYRNGYLESDQPDYGTSVGYTIFDINISVAAARNAYFFDYQLEYDGHKMEYRDMAKNVSMRFAPFLNQCKPAEVVVLKNSDGTDFASGYEKDYEGQDVEGKIVVVKKTSDLPITKLPDSAAAAGAVGIIVCDVGESFSSTFSLPIPGILVSEKYTQYFLDAPRGSTISISDEKVFMESDDGYTMSTASTQGPSPSLTISPDLTGVGSRIYTAIPAFGDDQSHYNGVEAFSYKDGTSFSSPNVAGTFACLLQALRALELKNEDGSSYSKADYRQLAVTLMRGSAKILEDKEGRIYSVRRQGAGLAHAGNAYATFTQGAYITQPLQELGHDSKKTGYYIMELELVNTSGQTVSYDQLQTHILIDEVQELDGAYQNLLRSRELEQGKDGEAIVRYFIKDSKTGRNKEVSELTLNAGETKLVQVSITLTDAAKEKLNTQYANGACIDGYVCFASSEKEDVQTHASFLTFYGDWIAVPYMENSDSFDYLQATYECNNNICEDGKTYAQCGYTPWDLMERKNGKIYTWFKEAVVLDRKENSIYMGENPLSPGWGSYRPEHNAFAPVRSDITGSFVGMKLYLPLRRYAKSLVMTVSDKNTGEIIWQAEENNKVTFRVDSQDKKTRFNFGWNGSAADGKSLVPSGTVVHVNIDAQSAYGGEAESWVKNVWCFDTVVDYTSPVIESVSYDKIAKILTVTARDENCLAGICLQAEGGASVLTQQLFHEEAPGEVCRATFDLSAYTAEEFTVTAVDYAGNRSNRCAHISATYTDQGESHDIVCTCGYRNTEEHSYTDRLCACGKKKLIMHTLDLASDISVNFVVSRNEISPLYYISMMVCEVPVYEGNIQTGTREIDLIPVEKGAYDYYTLNSLDATNMNDPIEVTLYGWDGEELCVLEKETYSIAAYAYSQLEKDSATKELKRLCADLLRYGGLAQSFKSYRTDTLADDAMTEEHKAYLTNLDTVVFNNHNRELKDAESSSVSWVGKALLLDSKVVLRYIVDTTGYSGKVEDLSLRVSYVDQEGEERTIELTAAQPYGTTAGRYSFDFKELTAAELRCVLKAAIYAHGVQLSNTLEYSMDTYGNNKTGTLGTLCKALFTYSDAAKAYFGN